MPIVGSRLIDVPGDGNCLWYSILTFLLGFEVKKDSEIVDIFKINFFKLVLQNRDKIVTEKDKPRRERGLNPNLVDFGHEAYRRCCSQYQKDPRGYHLGSFCVIQNSSLGQIQVTDLSDWCDVMSWKYSWGGTEVLSIIAGLTGLHFFTHMVPRGDQIVPFMEVKSLTKYGFKAISQQFLELHLFFSTSTATTTNF